MPERASSVLKPLSASAALEVAARKIMEDHGGQLLLEDREGGGARISLVFRRDAKEIASAHRQPAAAQ